jgi:glutamyl/glutaminyl-tRNA synthetase
MMPGPYVGRLAPTPTGFLHLGHAATFLAAHRRAMARGGRLLMRIDDIDTARCRAEFITAALEDLTWLGIQWHGNPIAQSSRRDHYLEAWTALRDAGRIYPCRRSRRDIESASAPHSEEPLFPVEWRTDPRAARDFSSPAGFNWRFRVPDGETISFFDARLGTIVKTAGRDFGDFLVWNHLDLPAYELSSPVDDATLHITEIVRGEDLLTSTARQILIFRALGYSPPKTFHTPLLRDEHGNRLAKRSRALAISTLRKNGLTPAEVITITLDHGGIPG